MKWEEECKGAQGKENLYKLCSKDEESKVPKET